MRRALVRGGLFAVETHAALAAFFADRTRTELEQPASERDIPLLTLAR